MAALLCEHGHPIDPIHTGEVERTWTIDPKESIFDKHILQTDWPDEIEIVELDYEYHEVYLSFDVEQLNLVKSELRHQGWKLEFSNSAGEAVYASEDPDMGGRADGD